MPVSCPEKRSAIQKRWYNKMMADPIRYEKYMERKRKGYKPRIKKLTKVPCATLLCRNTFIRFYPNNNRKFCDNCREFFDQDHGRKTVRLSA